MTVRVNKFTPENLLGAKRRSAVYPSADGKLALYACSTYSFETHSRSSEICVLDLVTGESTVISTDAKASEPSWLGQGHEVVWLREGDNGNTSLIVSNATTPGNSYTAGTIAGPVSNLKLAYIKPGVIEVAVAGQANPDGSLYNPKDATKSYSSARLYDSLFVRHWDTYVEKQRNSIFTAVLQVIPSKEPERQGRYNLVGFKNALRGLGLESPVPPFGGADHFDIGPKRLVFVAKDPDLDPATHTKCNVYFLRNDNLLDMSVAEPQQLTTIPDFNGAVTSPRFSADGNSVAFLQMKEDGYESDKNHILLIRGLDNTSPDPAVNLFEALGQHEWDHSPTSLTWSNDGRFLYLQAEDKGNGCLFSLSLYEHTKPTFQKLISTGYVTEVVPASKTSSKLLVSSNSLIDSSTYFILDPTTIQPPIMISSSSNAGNMFGLSPKQIRSLWWTGDNQHPVHAWMMVPSWFRPDHKYPLAYLIHGGPQGAWNDQWSTRWNPAIFAEQGYVVICPNPTGSTGYGQAFTDAIKSNWGGSPYIDLVEGFKYIEKELDFVDTERAVALGASYGGYMMNWIQGHDLGRKFKALVCHDGVFSMTAQLASDEQYFPIHDLGGPIWERQEVYDKWDPARFLKEWATPMLIIHNELDYRLTIAEGLSAFNVLQMKGIESRFLSFPDENHWVLKQENSLVWHLVVLNWINSFTGLPKVLDSKGRDGTEYLRQGKRDDRSSQA